MTSKFDWSDTNSQRLFDTEDAVDLYTKRMERPQFFPQEAKIVDRFFTDQEGLVLDVGCGAGRVSHLLHEHGYDVVGIDHSESLVAQARSISPGLDFFVADVRATPFESNSFGYVVFSYFGLDYILPETERLATLNEIHRLLEPGGRLVFSTHNSWHPLLPLSIRNLAFALKDVYDLYVRKKNRRRIGTQYKFESVPLGEIEIYLSNPIRQWFQLKQCGFTPLDVVGKRDGPLRFFERDPHFVAEA